MLAQSLFEKIWNAHLIESSAEQMDLIYIDRHILHEVSSPQAFSGLEQANRKVIRPELTFATTDHIVATTPSREEGPTGTRELISTLRENCKKYGITHFDVTDAAQGIVHVITPELGLALPGMTIVCGDSHTCTLGGIGTIAWGIGTSEVEHVLATQTLRLKRPKTFKIDIQGEAAPFVTAKDVILYVIGRLGTKAGQGYAIEYTGDYVKSLSLESRLTLCNLSIELGARMGIIAPDQTVFDYLKDRLHAPKTHWTEALKYWKTLYSDAEATFDQSALFNISMIGPQISWGTSPEQVISLHEKIPDPESFENPIKSQAAIRALTYMGLKANELLHGQKIDVVFIGSCTNGRLADLQEAARILKGNKVAPHVRALVVPGSMQVKKDAEQQGLDQIFINAGFEWRMPGCSMCVSLNQDKVAPGARCVSTSNRNFEGRQGPGSRTHIASPLIAVASAIKGYIAHPEEV